MKIYDISQEVFSCQVYPGDPAPQKSVLMDMNQGDLYNLTAFSMCAHNGTHIDAPAHFIKDGERVETLGLESFVGTAYVVDCQGVIDKEAALRIIEKAKAKSKEGAKRILIKGIAEVSLDAANVFAASDVLLLGCESQTFGPETAPMAVHLALLSKGVVLLEGLRLNNMPEGEYFLAAAPLNLAGAEGSPCRAVLIEGIEK
ncbi:MAG: cyclase family protein [Clostridia bacterium]|nr:cyclase family protein [Clostridia bacterium]